jgi:NTP pyrophosphatase (non-canonical NTP hydrolase)
MTFNEYQDLVTKTGYYPKEIELLYLGLGFGESGEIQNEIKKVYRDEHGQVTEARRAKIMDEISDLLWYLSVTLKVLGYSLEDVAKYNAVKVSKKQYDHEHGIDY